MAFTMSSPEEDFSEEEEEWVVQEWRAESFHEDCFLDEQRKSYR